MAVYLHVRLDFASGASLGPSRAAILEGIDRFKSISGSARAVGLSYQGVWTTVRQLNRLFPKPLVAVRVGGRGAGASLTPLGAELLARFRALERAAHTKLGAQIRGMERALGERMKSPAPIPRWATVADGRLRKRRKSR